MDISMCLLFAGAFVEVKVELRQVLSGAHLCVSSTTNIGSHSILTSRVRLECWLFLFCVANREVRDESGTCVATTHTHTYAHVHGGVSRNTLLHRTFHALCFEDWTREKKDDSALH